MAPKSVAVEGNASASAGSTLVEPAKAGSWDAGDVSETSYDFLTVDSTKVIWKAECTFSFTGDSDPPNGVVEDVHRSSTVTLEASGTALQGGSTFVLVDGDSTQDDYGNTVRVSASANLQADK